MNNLALGGTVYPVLFHDLSEKLAVHQPALLGPLGGALDGSSSRLV